MGPEIARKEKNPCRRKQQNTIAKQRSTTNTPPGITLKRRSITTVATIWQQLTMLTRRKVTSTMQRIMQQKRPSITRSITVTKLRVPEHE